jgi:pimeloyl-ACP methyl ester carboxylesterase
MMSAVPVSVTRMDVILIPGFWLDGSSWSDVAPMLEKAGHRVRALTLPGLESAGVDRSGVRLRDHVDAVVAAVDEIDGPVVLVGHSGGGAIAHAAADARPDRVARAVYVDSGPVGEGQAINDRLPVVDGEIPLPDWSEFDEADLRDLDDGLRAAFRARAVPEPAAVAYDPQVLTDERRYDVPTTVIACELTSGQLREWIAQDVPYVAELAAMHDIEYLDLPTGHWPQFTKPEQLGQAILAAVDRHRATSRPTPDRHHDA